MLQRITVFSLHMQIEFAWLRFKQLSMSPFASQTKDGDVLKKRRGVSTKTSGRFKKTLGMFRNSLMTAPFYPKKIKVRFSSSWLSVYTKDTDLQSISMTSRGKNGCHWLSEKCMTTNDNENTGLLSE